MTTCRRWIALALAALIVAPALPRAFADDEKVDGDLKKMQGQWSTKAGNGDKVTYTIDGKRLKVVAPSRTYEIVLTLVEDAKPEKTIDFKIIEAPEDAKGQTSKGIYKFDGEKFVFCFAPQGDRPAKYEMEGYEKILVTLTRDKD